MGVGGGGGGWQLFQRPGLAARLEAGAANSQVLAALGPQNGKELLVFVPAMDP